MHDAAAAGDIRQIRSLAASGVSLDSLYDSKTPVYIAAERNQPEAIEILVELGSRALDTPKDDGSGITPMIAAAGKGYPRVIDVLMQLGSQSLARADRNGLTPLHYAAMMGHDLTVIHLLSWFQKIFGTQRRFSAMINVEDRDGVTPLYFAARNRHPSTANILKTFGAIPNPRISLMGEPIDIQRMVLDPGAAIEMQRIQQMLYAL